MSESRQSPVALAAAADACWKDLHRVAFMACIVFVASIAVAVIATFIWPCVPGLSTVEGTSASL